MKLRARLANYEYHGKQSRLTVSITSSPRPFQHREPRSITRDYPYKAPYFLIWRCFLAPPSVLNLIVTRCRNGHIKRAASSRVTTEAR